MKRINIDFNNIKNYLFKYKIINVLYCESNVDNFGCHNFNGWFILVGN